MTIFVILAIPVFSEFSVENGIFFFSKRISGLQQRNWVYTEIREINNCSKRDVMRSVMELRVGRKEEIGKALRKKLYREYT